MDYRVVLDSPEVPTSTIQIAKLGNYKDVRYGDFSITAEDVTAWKDNLALLPGGKALIDLDHRADKTGAARSTEAAGWITDIHLADGVPKATVEWTPVGQEAIAQRRYQFFSPAFGQHRIEGEVHENVLSGGALTNKPFLRMATVQLASEDRVAALMLEDAGEEELLLLSAHILLASTDQRMRDKAVKENNALPDGSYPIPDAAHLKAAAILAASRHGKWKAALALIRRRSAELGVKLSTLPGFKETASDKKLDSPSAMLTPEVAKKLQLDEDADETAILAAIEALQAAPEPPAQKTLDELAKDEKKVVLDADVYTALSAKADEGAAAKKQLDAERFDRTFEKAQDKGKAVEAQREQYQNFYNLDADSTIKMLEDAPVIVNTERKGRGIEDGAAAVDAAPEGVHEQSFLLDQAVRKKLLDEKRPISDYTQVARELQDGGMVLA